MEIRFKLNSKNVKDQIIIDYLKGEYSATDTIKALLYRVATGTPKSDDKVESNPIQGIKIESNIEEVTPKNDDKVETVSNKTEFDEFF